ncbi:unnamed protein product [Moneuplotes crassus]|uniref:Uncharacterized protein n=1 Tax=Euplotes crassus TaxID=5936 RepID=A0AAD1UAK2_EUPCR|nr:unnamed protein product [Moneuplotes crassus]
MRKARFLTSGSFGRGFSTTPKRWIQGMSAIGPTEMVSYQRDLRVNQQKISKATNKKLGGTNLHKRSLISFFKDYQQLFNQKNFIEKIIPRKIESHEQLEKMGCTLYEGSYETDLESANKALIDPLYELLDLGGKRWRPVYGMVIANDYGMDLDGPKSDPLYHVLAGAEILHNASIIIDDIEDQSLMRRGAPCAYLKYGQDIAINMGNFVMTTVLTDFVENFNYVPVELKMKMISELTKEISCLHFGQNWDICWHNNYKLPTQSEYFQMCASKTSVIPRLITTMVGLLNKDNPTRIKKLRNMINDLGIAFQIQDDIISLESDVYAKSRGIFGEDIHEGKRTLMVIHSVENLPKSDGKRLIDILNMKTDNDDIIREAIQMIQSTKSIEYAKSVSFNLIESYYKDMEEVMHREITKGHLKGFANYLINRDM